MRFCRTLPAAGLIILLVSLVGCSNTEEDESRTITVIMKNLANQAVNIFLEGQQASDANLVQPGEEKTTSFTAKSLNHAVSLYVERDGTGLFTTQCYTGSNAWENRTAEVHWTGAALLCVNW